MCTCEAKCVLQSVVARVVECFNGFCGIGRCIVAVAARRARVSSMAHCFDMRVVGTFSGDAGWSVTRAVQWTVGLLGAQLRLGGTRLHVGCHAWRVSRETMTLAGGTLLMRGKRVPTTYQHRFGKVGGLAATLRAASPNVHDMLALCFMASGCTQCSAPLNMSCNSPFGLSRLTACRRHRKVLQHVFMVTSFWFSAFAWSPFMGVRVGEAANPGPPINRERALAHLHTLGLYAGSAEDDGYASCNEAASQDGMCTFAADAGSEVASVAVTEVDEHAVTDPYVCAEVGAETVNNETSNSGGAQQVDVQSDRFADVLPGPRARLAVNALMRVVTTVAPGISEAGAVVQFSARHRWSAFNVPLLWAAAAGRASHDILEWMANMLDHEPAPCQFEGSALSSARLRGAWANLHRLLGSRGISNPDDLLTWLESRNFSCQGVGGYFHADAQEALWNDLAEHDSSILIFEATFVAVALHMWRDVPMRLSLQGSIPHRIDASEAGQSTRLPSQAPQTNSRSSPAVARLPDAWAQLDAVDLQQEIQIGIKTTKGVPRCIRGAYHRILTQALVAVERAHASIGASSQGELHTVRAWKLFILLPRLLLHVARRGGEAGEREFQKRVVLFDEGRWVELLVQAHQQATVTSVPTRGDEADKIRKAVKLVEEGELSHAARMLYASELAPGSQATLDELRDPALRPQAPQEDLPENIGSYVPATPVTLDKQVFGDVLREARRGVSSGMFGNRNEYLKLCLEDDVAFNALYDVSQLLARALVPEEITEALRISGLTALLKPNRRIRGISAADTFRRLVTKCLARQHQNLLRQCVWPDNFGLCDRSGTDMVAHLLRYVTDEDPTKVVLSIDGVGAFDHISRARMFEALLATPELNSLVPFVRQWYASPSRYMWRDSQGTMHEILQGDGGEQGDAMMPALFCLALKSALTEIKQGLPEGASIHAYLDDIYVTCDRADAALIFHRIQEILSRVCHIDVNLGKLAAWSKADLPAPDGFSTISSEAWKADKPDAERGVKILGTPLGTPAFVEACASETLLEKSQLLNFLPKLPSLQASWLLLYFCAVPRINHLLRTVPPDGNSSIANAHDDSIRVAFRTMFGIPGEASWDADLHKMSYEACANQAQLPLRLGGCGLRNSTRTAHAAYWASWADSLQGLCQRYPGIGSRMLRHLTTVQAATFPAAAPRCILQAELSGTFCEASGWDSRPGWADLAAGLRPPQPDMTQAELGEWRHGWQFHAGDGIERHAQSELKQLLALPSTRRNAACAGKARLLSCTGRFASAWMVVAPTSDSLTFTNQEILIAMRRRLGVATSFEGPDAHGHASLATNTGARMNARHTEFNAAWRQVFTEAGGNTADRNVERMLRNTHIPTHPSDGRRLDLVVPGLNVARGLPLFCDGTVLTPLTAFGQPRPGTSNSAGGLLAAATVANNNTYREVVDSGLGALFCLGAEVFGRLSSQAVDLLPALARERSRGLHPRLRRSTAHGLLHRWSGIVAVGLQRAVAHIVARDTGADLARTQLEPVVELADLATV